MLASIVIVEFLVVCDVVCHAPLFYIFYGVVICVCEEFADLGIHMRDVVDVPLVTIGEPPSGVLDENIGCAFGSECGRCADTN